MGRLRRRLFDVCPATIGFGCDQQPATMPVLQSCYHNFGRVDKPNLNMSPLLRLSLKSELQVVRFRRILRPLSENRQHQRVQQSDAEALRGFANDADYQRWSALSAVSPSSFASLKHSNTTNNTTILLEQRHCRAGTSTRSFAAFTQLGQCPDADKAHAGIWQRVLAVLCRSHWFLDLYDRARRFDLGSRQRIYVEIL